MTSDFLSELAWRGMIQDSTPRLAEHLASGTRAAYIGFDPTASSLHIGNLATVQLLAHWHRAGHKVVALVGGATGMIGDPSGKKAERQLLTRDVVEQNVAAQRKQLERLIGGKADEITLVDNYDWYSQMGMIDFLRDVGKHLTVNYMMAKDSVKSRLETGISFTEFSYQLLQGYDFQVLHERHGVTVQMGGSDQWGNITSGIEMIRRTSGGEAFALTTPLLTKADGTKFGKSEQGNVWLDASLTTPYQFYQYFLNVADEDVEKLLKVLTFLPKAELEGILESHRQAPHLRQAQQRLAEEITARVHGGDELKAAQTATSLLFGKGSHEDWKSLDKARFEALKHELPNYKLEGVVDSEDVISLLSNGTSNQLFPSKGEARKMMQGGGVQVNFQKVSGPEKLSDFTPFHDKYLLVQKGKKNYAILEIGF